MPRAIYCLLLLLSWATLAQDPPQILLGTKRWVSIDKAYDIATSKRASNPDRCDALRGIRAQQRKLKIPPDFFPSFLNVETPECLRSEALRALGESKTEEGRQTVVRWLKMEKALAPQIAAVHGLASNGDPHSLDVLKNFLDPILTPTPLRRRTLETLRDLDWKHATEKERNEAVTSLLPVLRSKGKDLTEVKMATLALASIAAPSAIPVLAELRRHPNFLAPFDRKRPRSPPMAVT
jgi:hypothetical protein